MNCLRIKYGVCDSRLTVVYNGLDSNFRNIDNLDTEKLKTFKKKYGLEGKQIILYYGHCGKSKGIDYLVQATKQICNISSDILLVYNLIDSKRTNKIKEQINHIVFENKLQKSVKIFNGFDIENLRNLVASSDIVVAPSISEGFGSVHTESISMGKTLITTYIGPLKEVLWGKVKFIKPGSSQAIVDAIKEIQKGEIENLPKKSYSREQNIEKVNEIIEKI